MEVGFADTFFDSFKRMINRERWYWKTWDFFRYDLSRGLKNMRMFHKAVWNYTWWSGQHAVLPLLQVALNDMATRIERDGIEEETSSAKKVKAMKRVSALMQHFIADDFIQMAEAELGEIIHHPWEFKDVPDKPGYSQLVDHDTAEEREHNSKVFARSREIEEQEWAELWHLIKGQDYSKFKKTLDDSDHQTVSDNWANQFDGSGLRGWWD